MLFLLADDQILYSGQSCKAFSKKKKRKYQLKENISLHFTII